MKLNELICPSCGLKCLVDASYTTCDGCQTYFSAAQSRSRDNPAPLGAQITVNPYITAPLIQPLQPQIMPWVVTPNDPSATGGGSVTSTVVPDGVTYEVWN
jgi:hypothetical protein